MITPTCKKANFGKQSDNLLLLRRFPQCAKRFRCIYLKTSLKMRLKKISGGVEIDRDEVDRETKRKTHWEREGQKWIQKWRQKKRQ